MKKIIPFLVLSIVLVSCNDKKSSEDSTQMKRVIAIHDEVMPKMGRLSKLVAELKGKVDTTAMGREYEVAMKDLQAANQSMMTWMQDFGERFNHDEILNGKELSPKKQEWLDEEEEKVKALREEINSSIAKAESLLEDN